MHSILIKFGEVLLKYYLEKQEITELHVTQLQHFLKNHVIAQGFQRL
jgi:dihydrofolate reductase